MTLFQHTNMAYYVFRLTAFTDNQSSFIALVSDIIVAHLKHDYRRRSGLSWI